MSIVAGDTSVLTKSTYQLNSIKDELLEDGTVAQVSSNEDDDSDDDTRYRMNNYPLFPKDVKELLALFPGVLMVLLFGYTYVAIVTSDNPHLKEHAGFLFCWSQISNIAITLSAGIFGSTKWVVGGANTTSAIMLRVLLKNANIETALFIQGLSSLFTAIIFLAAASFGGLGRLF
eukprot:11732341-Ditylum_brightwellii.AAC.1